MMFSPEYPPMVHGGLGTHVKQLTAGLKAHIEQLDVFTYSGHSGGCVGRVDEGNLHVHFCQPRDNDFPLYGKRFLQQMAETVLNEAKNFMRESKAQPDIVHCHDWHLFRAAHDFASDCGIPLITTIHFTTLAIDMWGESPTIYAAGQEHLACTHSRAIIVPSGAMRDLLSSSYHGISDKIYVIPHGVPAQDSHCNSLSVSREEHLRSFDLPPNTDGLIVYAGRLAAEKGVIDLLRAAEQIITRYPRAIFAIVGDYKTKVLSAYPPSLLKWVLARPQISKNIKFLGKLEWDRLQILYSIADIAVVPSVFEAFGYTAAEAMGAGVPVVASDTGGLSSLIEDGRTGLLIPMIQAPDGTISCSIEKLVAAISWLLENPEDRRALGKNGKTRISSQSIEGMVGKTLEVYNESLHGRAYL
jgi:alpha-maltose-1-phosphate synthase